MQRRRRRRPLRVIRNRRHVTKRMKSRRKVYEASMCSASERNYCAGSTDEWRTVQQHQVDCEYIYIMELCRIIYDFSPDLQFRWMNIIPHIFVTRGCEVCILLIAFNRFGIFAHSRFNLSSRGHSRTRNKNVNLISMFRNMYMCKF